jgi:CDP-diacylglycerol--serine O-phosphatidyltransferase
MMAFIWTMNVLGYAGGSVTALALAVTITAALLMVSRIRYTSFKSLPLADRVPFVAMLLAVGVFVALAIDPPRVLLAIVVLYALSGPLQWLVGRIRRARSRGTPTDP